MKEIIKKILFPFSSGYPELKKYWWHRLCVCLYFVALYAFYILSVNTQDKLCTWTDYSHVMHFCSASEQIQNIVVALLIAIFASYALQVFYYKVFIYIIFGKK